MKNFWPLVMLQFRDKLDLSWAKKKKTFIQKLVFFTIKFLLLGGGTFGLMYLLVFVGFLKGNDEIIHFYSLFFALMLLLNLISATVGLMKTLYFADDNKVLVTLPVGSSQLFFSKILVYFFFQIKRDIDIFNDGEILHR